MTSSDSYSDMALPKDALASRASRFRRAPTRLRIVEATAEVAARRGFGGVSVAGVAAAAETSRSTVYEHFADRNACFLAALDHHGRRLIDHLESLEPDLLRRLDQVINSLCVYSAADPVSARLLFVETLAAGGEAMGFRERLLRRTVELTAAPSGCGPVQTGVTGSAAETLFGGVFRLLAVRLSRASCENPGGLDAPGLALWAASYSGALMVPANACDSGLSFTEPFFAADLERKTLLPGRQRLTEAEIDHHQRKRVHASIARLSSEFGYERTSVADITASAHISRNAFYKHFRGKEDAANRALEVMLRQVIGSCAAAFTSSSYWPESVWRAGREFAGLFAASREHAYLGLVETHVVGEEMVSLIYDRLGAFTLFLEAGYRWRPQAEELPRVCSEAIAATMYEITFRALREHREPAWYLEMLPQLVYICLAPFMGHAAAMEFVSAKCGQS
jgi:TetR/AcrR family transcriptional regulator